VYAPVAPAPEPPTAAELCADGALPVRAAAEFLGVSLNTLKALAREKHLKLFKVRNRLVVARRALVLYLAGQMDPAPNPTPGARP
jgi:hypothetical protein